MGLKKFNYSGRNVAGQVVYGEVHAYDRETALRSLRVDGITITQLEVVDTTLGQARPDPNVFMKGNSLALMYRQLVTLYGVGFPLDASFRLMANQAGDASERKVLRGMSKAMLRGMSVSEAMSLFPGTFAKPHIAMVEIGEYGGLMPVVLETLSNLTEQSDRLQRKIVSSLTYPAVVLLVSLITIFGLFNFVLPSFFELVKEMHVELPLVTRIVIATAKGLTSRLFLPGTILLLMLLSYIWRRLRRQKAVRYLLDTLALSAIIVGPITHKVSMARSMQMLAALTRAGIPLADGLPLAGAACGNTVIANAYKEVAEELRQGNSLASSMKLRSRIFSGSLIAYVEVGEQTGNLPDMLVKSAEVMTMSAHYALEVLPDLVEPVIIVLLGALCGIILISIFVPLYAALRNI